MVGWRVGPKRRLATMSKAMGNIMARSGAKRMPTRSMRTVRSSTRKATRAERRTREARRARTAGPPSRVLEQTHMMASSSMRAASCGGGGLSSSAMSGASTAGLASRCLRRAPGPTPRFRSRMVTRGKNMRAYLRKTARATARLMAAAAAVGTPASATSESVSGSSGRSKAKAPRNSVRVYMPRMARRLRETSSRARERSSSVSTIWQSAAGTPSNEYESAAKIETTLQPVCFGARCVFSTPRLATRARQNPTTSAQPTA
mmetsp:Transcript_4274/g.13069  ORF Transcript_4274/g.13069 Transcript_4274/m.13069 type:complete len:260 (-) Transcript_4274:528-1307(-)